jgi:Bacteriophage T4-like portal protein (Gp20)
MQLFGFEIKRSKDEQVLPIPSVVPPSNQDGSTIVNTGVNAGGYYGMVVDLDASLKNENDLIRRYREISQYTDCDAAIEDIVNEALISDETKRPVEILLDDVKVSSTIKTKISDEFSEILRLLKFNDRGHEIFRQWYIDGRLYYQVLFDESNVKAGIHELRFIDPRKIRKIKNIKKEKTPQGVEIIKTMEEFYLYNDKGMSEQSTQGVKFPLDSVVHCPSGVMDMNTGMTLSHLHKAIKPTNQLKMIEDSLVIYRISRAPERRIFYVDVGNLPKLKAEQYVNDIMNKFRNKIVYDATTGETRDDRRHLSMMEDFWMPRREGGKGTEISTLPGGQNLGAIEDIEYFQNKLYHSLNVPVSRMQQSEGFSIGRSNEITRDEVKFNKFIVRLRKKFAVLFLEALKVQLVAKNIVNIKDWDEIRHGIRFDFLEDNHYAELKDAELLTQRVTLLQQIEPFIGRFYSDEWIKRNLLRMTDDQIEAMDKQIKDSLQTNITFSQNKGEQQLAQQQPTMEFQAQQQQAMQTGQQPQGQDAQQAAAQEAGAQQAADKDAQKPVGKKKPTGEQKDSFDWNN